MTTMFFLFPSCWTGFTIHKSVNLKRKYIKISNKGKKTSSPTYNTQNTLISLILLRRWIGTFAYFILFLFYPQKSWYMNGVRQENNELNFFFLQNFENEMRSGPSHQSIYLSVFFITNRKKTVLTEILQNKIKTINSL